MIQKPLNRKLRYFMNDRVHDSQEVIQLIIQKSQYCPNYFKSSKFIFLVDILKLNKEQVSNKLNSDATLHFYLE